MVNIPEIWSKYQKYGQNTRSVVNIPEIWSLTIFLVCWPLVNIPEIWSAISIPEILSTYQKYGPHTRNMVNIPQKKKVKYLDKKYKKFNSLKKKKNNSKVGTHRVRQQPSTDNSRAASGVLLNIDHQKKNKYRPNVTKYRPQKRAISTKYD